jgi:hypothetical protein
MAWIKRRMTMIGTKMRSLRAENTANSANIPPALFLAELALGSRSAPSPLALDHVTSRNPIYREIFRKILHGLVKPQRWLAATLARQQ